MPGRLDNFEQEIVISLQGLGSFCQSLPDLRVVLFQDREQFMAQAVAEKLSTMALPKTIVAVACLSIGRDLIRDSPGNLAILP